MKVVGIIVGIIIGALYIWGLFKVVDWIVNDIY